MSKLNFSQNTEKTAEAVISPKNNGGLYKHVNVSLKTINIVIVISAILLFLCMWILVSTAGFTVTFDTDGGSAVKAESVMHGDLISPPTPVKEGYTFTGWYYDREATVKWDIAKDEVTDDVTLYAGWQKK